MSKKNIRILAIGFFVSGLILLMSAILMPNSPTASGQTEKVKDLESDITYLEEKIAQLELEQPVAAEQPSEKEETAESEENSEKNETEEAAEEESQATEEDQTEEQADEEAVITATITINEGEPSSVAAGQLEANNILEDSMDFDDFLEENDYAPYVRPGNYDISSDMSYEQIAQTLMGH